MDHAKKDKRFAHVAKDPRFRRMPVAERKVKIDKRFKGMFNDKKFKLKYSVDKRGKAVSISTNENLKKYYDLSDDSDSDNENLDIKVANDSEDSESDTEEVVVKSTENKQKKKGKFKTTDKRFQASFVEDEQSESDTDNEAEDVGQSDSSDNDINAKSKSVKKVKKPNKKNLQAIVKKSPQKGKSKKEKVLPEKVNDSDEDSDDSDDDEEDFNFDQKNIKEHEQLIRSARGEGNVVSSSDDDDDTTSEDDDDDNQKDDRKFDHGWGDDDPNIISLEEATYRLAVCNVDWDRIKAKDIFVLLNSFKPANGLIKSVKIYPSEYGKERIAEETTHGPRELKEITINEEEDEDSNNDMAETIEGTSYHREKLREYQLQRLKYYYAVIVCDTPLTADTIYKECDGIEFESSASKLDLRFIPDEETFEESEVKTSCMEVPTNYKPQHFLNAALRQTKVELTWDETDHERVNITNQPFIGKGEDVEDEDLKAYLASSSDEDVPDYNALLGVGDDDDNYDDDDESDEDKKINKYKQLITDIETEERKKRGDVEMEISWEPDLKETAENLVKKKQEKNTKSVWDDYLEKRKEKKKQKIEERKKKRERRDVDNVQENDFDDSQVKEGEMVQTFSDDDVEVDASMAAFMAEEKNTQKQKKNKKKKKKKKQEVEETPEMAKQKAELALLMMDEEENKRHFNIKDLVEEDNDGKKKKKKKDKMKKTSQVDEDFKMNVTDPRFSAVFDSHLYNIDPSAPEYRNTKGTEAIISEKIKRSYNKDRNKRSGVANDEENTKRQKLDEIPKKDESLASLIKSVKSKTAHFHGNKSKR
ncbi:pre-rRNA-processing protein esf1 [Mactra antiquata]